MEGIRALVKAQPRGRVFTPSDFIAMGSRAAIDQALSRLTAQGVVRRIARGLYDRPRRHRLLGPLMPSSDAILRALGTRGHQRLQPSGAYAANLLGLTEQVPLRIVFLTDGASQTIQVGGHRIVMRHTTPRNMATAGRTSGLVIQALRHLKRANVDAKVIGRLAARLTAKDRARLEADAMFAPAWIARVMRHLAATRG
jgi:hypothetical protein